MFLMLAEVMHLHDLAEIHPGNKYLEWLKFHTTHVPWAGCSLHDMIQPAFTFLVGVSMPFSIKSRLKRGDTRFALLVHALWRSFLLIALGIVLRSLGKESTNFTFDDTLTQIGLGYFFVFLIAMMPRFMHYTALAAVLIGFWGYYAYHPAPPDDFDYAAVGVPEDWPHHYDGFAARWNKNSNLSALADKSFLNIFPRDVSFEYHRGGYATMSFIPTAGTILMGLLAGFWMRKIRPSFKLWKRFMIAGAVGIAAGWVLDWSEICPLVKRIWTPSFALYSGGICMLWLLILHWICDVWKLTLWAFPLIVIGSNSILIYVMSWTLEQPFKELLRRHVGDIPFSAFDGKYVDQFQGLAVLMMMFLILLWFYRQRAFVKI